MYQRYDGIYGAAIGDIVGSPFEFQSGKKPDRQSFPLFSSLSIPTDDTIMTAAVADYLINKGKMTIVESLKKWGAKYPFVSYGASFQNWLSSSNSEPYFSYGNGAAMRISPVAYFAKSEKEVIDLSFDITKVTHDHPEGLKGGMIVADCIYKALHGGSKDDIKKFASQYYNLDFDYFDLVKNYSFNETCQGTIPQAIYCFLISSDFEDCLRLCVSIRGDCDTLCAISCSIAEAYYKEIPSTIIKTAKAKIPFDVDCVLSSVIKSF